MRLVTAPGCRPRHRPASIASLVWRLAACSALVVAAAAAAACSSDAPAEDLAGVRWRLLSYVTTAGETVEALDETVVTATFDGDTVSGSGGCNTFSAGYETDGDSIEIGPVAATLMACPEPVMAQEQVFFEGLGAAAEFRATEDELVLLDDSGTELLRFDATEPAALEGTYWVAWQTDGTLSSGPWAPPVTILGQTTTGNGQQSITGGPYAPVSDVGGQGFPFIIEGQSGPISVESSSWTQVKALYR